MPYYAHYRESDHAPQHLRCHLQSVCRLSEQYGAALGVSHVAGLAGLLHDAGKYTDAFQEYLHAAVFQTRATHRGEVDHSTIGAQLLWNRYHAQGDAMNARFIELLVNAILSHHSYLNDYLNLDAESPVLRRMEKRIPGYDAAVSRFFEDTMPEPKFDAYVAAARQEFFAFFARYSAHRTEKATLFLRFLFSCLIDADRTDTRQFEQGTPDPVPVDSQALFSTFCDRVEQKIQSFGTPTDTVNQLRRSMSDTCAARADGDQGVYRLSMPTGGGKTLASLRYAVRHAKRHHLKHIIYVAPYMTIIEQNARVVRDALCDDLHILEHHSNVAPDIAVNRNQALRLMRDNWDAPVILTTMVQFLNTFYARSSQSIRRLHHLSEAVVIFDEVQKVPTFCLTLFNQAVNFLSDSLHSTVLLCTATQPALTHLPHSIALSSPSDLVLATPAIQAGFKRVTVVDHTDVGALSAPALADFVKSRFTCDHARHVLVVLNTKSAVHKLYAALSGNTSYSLYYLSTRLCAAHRIKLLNEIRAKLKLPDPIICVSTPLIEAGVDISFDSVIRSLAGLDSIAQTAGRCNRNGESAVPRFVYLVDAMDERLDSLDDVARGKRVTKQILASFRQEPDAFDHDLLSGQAIRTYFQWYYSDMIEKMDFATGFGGQTIEQLLHAGRRQSAALRGFVDKYHVNPPLCLLSSMRQAADAFYVIPSQRSVLVPYGEGDEMIRQLMQNEISAQDLLVRRHRVMQHYMVTIYDSDYQQLEKSGRLLHFGDDAILAITPDAYTQDAGLI